MDNGQLEPIDFEKRRKTFLGKLKGGVALFPSAPDQLRNSDVHQVYRQESNFFYLSGFEEPKSFLLFSAESRTPFQMFVHPKDKTKEIWEGKLLGPEGAKSQLGADAAFPSVPDDTFREAFVTTMLEANRLYYAVGHDPKMDQMVFDLMKLAARRLGRTGRVTWPILDPTELLGDMRLVKTRGEIERLQIAGHISAEGHAHAMRISKPGMFEYEVEAALYHSFRVQGAARLGYPSIVASGSNACCLHYNANNRQMKDGDLLLIDAAGEFEYYSADITRTFPINGTFTKEQRDIYSAVLKSQKSCIAMVRPGRTLREIHEHATEVLVEELKKLKMLKGPAAQIIKKKEHMKFYPHGTGHWLGMDVHDVGTYYTGKYTQYRKLEPGNVFTIEPGLYFQPNDSGGGKYKGIGVRIEDDILVTSSGCKVLTSGVPKEIDEIESLCSSP